MTKGRFICFIFFFSSIVMSAYPQFFKVYGYGTRAENEAEIVLWNTYIADSDLNMTFFGKPVEREGLWAHSIELEYGITDRLTIAAYLDFEDPPGRSFQYTRARAVFFRYRFADKGSFFIDPAIYIEYYVPRKSYEDSEELEIRLILEKDIGNVRIILNPMFEKKTSGSEVNEGLEFNYAFGIYYRKYRSIQPGLEFFGKMGEISDFKPRNQQRHWVFPTVDFRFGPGFHWQIGAGWGLTDAADSLTIKSIFSYEF